MADQNNHNAMPHIAPDAATLEPPVRVDMAGEIVWLRPSNVLRIETQRASIGCPVGVNVILSDGKQLFYRGADWKTADAVAALLWPHKGV